METVEMQREIIKFLLMRLKVCAFESAGFRAVFANLAEEQRQPLIKMMENYRDSEPIRKKVEIGFQQLDSLIQQVNEAPDRELARTLLESWNPQGPVN